MKKQTDKIKNTVQAVCQECDGTGLYEGMFRKKGELVICTVCNGTGCQEIEYEPFVVRKRRRGVKVVYLTREMSIGTSVGKTRRPMTYGDFLSDKWRKHD
jgi:hypothetical protein